MNTAKIVGYKTGVKSKKNGNFLVLLFVTRQKPDVIGFETETIFVRQECITGGALALGAECRVYYDRGGYVQEVQILEQA